MFGYEQAAGRAVEWLTGQLDDIESYRGAPDDLACYYKSPYLLSLSGRPREASRLLSYVRRRFGTDDGDFRTTVGHKTTTRSSTSTGHTRTGGWPWPPNGWAASISPTRH